MIVAYFSSIALSERSDNVYDVLGVTVDIPSDALYMAYRINLEKVSYGEDYSAKERLEEMWRFVRGMNRPVYRKMGDHMIRMDMAVVEWESVVLHALGLALVLGAIANMFLSGEPTETFVLVNGYLFTLFALDCFLRLVDDSFVPSWLLTFEVIQTAWALFPAFAVSFITIVKSLGIRRKGERVLIAIRRALAANSDLRNALVEPQSKPIQLIDYVDEPPSDIGAIVNTVIGAAILIASIINRD